MRKEFITKPIKIFIYTILFSPLLLLIPILFLIFKYFKIVIIIIGVLLSLYLFTIFVLVSIGVISYKFMSKYEEEILGIKEKGDHQ